MRLMLMTYQLPEAPPPPKLPPPPLKPPLDDDPLLQPPDDEPLDHEPRREDPVPDPAPNRSAINVRTAPSTPTPSPMTAEPITNQARTPTIAPVIPEPNKPPEHGAQDASDDQRAEQQEVEKRLDVVPIAEIHAARGRRQRLAVDDADHAVDARRDAAGEIAAPEFRRDGFIDDAPRRDVGERALEAVTDLDAQMPVVLGHNEDGAVVDLLASDLPGLRDADRELLDGLRVRRRHDQDGDLAALAHLEVLQLLRQRGDVAAGERAGLIDHAAGQLRHGDIG
ncbi:hypothetical protein ACVWXL_006177 [Bradyrhizobium sp. GM22.5]